MKTAISIPDRLFRQADRLAKQLGMSRSELYAKAVAEYLRLQSQEGITEQLNRVYGPNPELSKMDPALLSMQARTLAKGAKRGTW